MTLLADAATTLSLENQWKEAAKRLFAKKLLGPGESWLSVRVAGKEDSLLGPLSSTVDANEFAPASISTCQDPLQTKLHRFIYRVRGDVGAIIFAHPKWASSLSDIPSPMPSVFDEQVRQLGKSVERLSFENLSDVGGGSKKLASGNNAFLIGGGVLVLGYSLDRAVFNIELLEKCALSFNLAHLTGEKIFEIPWLIQFIAHRRLLKDERIAKRFYSSGNYPIGLGGY